MSRPTARAVANAQPCYWLVGSHEIDELHFATEAEALAARHTLLPTISSTRSVVRRTWNALRNGGLRTALQTLDDALHWPPNPVVHARCWTTVPVCAGCAATGHVTHYPTEHQAATAAATIKRCRDGLVRCETCRVAPAPNPDRVA